MNTSRNGENWYIPTDPASIPSPALLIFPTRVEKNIRQMIDIAGQVERLRPHVKTHKLPQIVSMHQARGIEKFKCATIAEAEMLASCAVKDILLAYQPVGPNQERLIRLAELYRALQIGCLVDNVNVLRELSAKLSATELTLQIWVDIDNGNGRTGIRPNSDAENLVKLILDSPGVVFGGLHVYDGQFGGLTFEERSTAASAASKPVREMVANLAAEDIEVPNVVAGGTPTFPVHAQQTDYDLSPGTYSLWDMGYATTCPELPFIHAAVLLTRVVSKPGRNRLCLDLGHKAVAAENPLENRVRFLNAPAAQYLDQKEEHLVIELPEDHGFEVGDLLYGIPWHICPTVALYQEAHVVNDDRKLIDRWPIKARRRRLTV